MNLGFVDPHALLVYVPLSVALFLLALALARSCPRSVRSRGGVASNRSR